MSERIYPSKLLLFGEYAVISGGPGLAIPYHKFLAKWIFNKNAESQYKVHLFKFLNYLRENNFYQLNLSQFQNDLENGLDIESNIPIGYGVGSSGAIVSGVYDKYAINKIHENSLVELKLFFGSMENYFHQKSSGLDPLVCYLNKAIRLKGSGELETIQELPLLKKITIALFDTGQNRLTNKLVETFKEALKKDYYYQKIHNEYLPIVSDNIENYLSANEGQLISALKKLSAFQLEYFDFAIPEEIRNTWAHGLQSGNKIFKLCGAGGGGFMICFSTND